MPAKKIANRDAKAKRLLIILVPAIVVVGVLQGPKVLALVGGGGDPVAQDVAAAPVDPAVPAAGEPAAAASGATLQNSTRRPAVDLGELGGLRRFAGRDPFVPRITGSVGGEAAQETPEAELPEPPAPGGGPAETPADPAPAPGGPESPESAPADPAPAPVAAAAGLAPSTAIITVNGAPQEIAAGEAFPSADPVFRLSALDVDGGEIGLVDGQFSTGAGTITIAVGETRTLVSQPDGTRFRVRLVRVIG